MLRAKAILTFALLAFSAFGVTFSGPVIMRTAPQEKSWDFGPAANLIGAVLDVVGGFGMVLILINMARNKYFTTNAESQMAGRAFKFMVIVSVIGIIGDVVGGLFAIAAQIALYTSLLNMRSMKKP
jgi:hypothetical protein